MFFFCFFFVVVHWYAIEIGDTKKFIHLWTYQPIKLYKKKVLSFPLNQ